MLLSFAACASSKEQKQEGQDAEVDSNPVEEIDMTGWGPISTIIRDENVVINKDESITIVNTKGYTDQAVYFETPIKMGQKVTFDIEVSHSQGLATFLFANGINSANNEYFAHWIPVLAKETHTIEIDSIKIVADMDCFGMIFRYSYEKPEECTLTIRNLKIEDAPSGPDSESTTQEFVPNADGSFSISNPQNAREIDFVWSVASTKGQKASFDLTVNKDMDVYVWMCGDGNWSKLWYAQKHTVKAGESIPIVVDGSKVKDNSDFYLISIKYSVEDATDVVATLNNLKLD